MFIWSKNTFFGCFAARILAFGKNGEVGKNFFACGQIFICLVLKFGGFNMRIFKHESQNQSSLAWGAERKCPASWRVAFGLFGWLAEVRSKTSQKAKKARSQMLGIAVEHRPEGQKINSAKPTRKGQGARPKLTIANKSKKTWVFDDCLKYIK